jgi:crotonobetainyl-CoA:carnitine CoA-transferase CaiB-like acyl-CoA transferase
MDMEENIQKPGIFDEIRVLDFTTQIQGPYVTRQMADMGAEIIKVERPGEGDPTRWAPYIMAKGESGNFMQRNCGKKSISLDLKRPEAIEIIKQLAKISDVAVENFRPGVMTRLGIGYPKLREVNPRIIMCSLSGFGQYGPYFDRPTGDTLIQALTLGMEMTGDPDGPPQICGLAYVDFCSGAHGLAAVSAALYYREKTGIGQHIDIALFDVAFGMHESAIEEYILSGGKIKYTRFGSHKKDLVPVGVYKGRDGYLAIGAVGDRAWADIAKVIGRPELIKDKRFDTQIHRVENREEVIRIINEWIQNCSSVMEADRLLNEGNVPSAPVLNIDQLMNYPQVEARELLAEVEHPTFGKLKVVNSPFHFSETASGAKGYPPRIGEHNEEVLTALLGYSMEQIEGLYKKGILYHIDREEG